MTYSILDTLKNSLTPRVLITGAALGFLLAGSGIVYQTFQYYKHPKKVVSYDEAAASIRTTLEDRGQSLPHAQTVSGAFLSSLFAQRNQQWDHASRYMDELQSFHGNDDIILKKSLEIFLDRNPINTVV